MLRRMRMSWVAPASILVTLLAVDAEPRTAPPVPPRVPLEDRVNPFIGSAGRGSTMPGPALPHSSIYPSPDTLNSTPGGYKAGEPIVGFSQLHTQGTGGNPSYGNFLITPWRGLAITEAEHATPKSDEVARAYAYRVHLDTPNVGVEIVPAAHSALYRFTFPDADDSHILLDVARKVGGVVALQDGSVSVDAATGTIEGGGTFAKNWNPAPYEVYFAARVSATPSDAGTWVGPTVQTGVTQASSTGQSLGAFLRFKTRATKPVFLKIAISLRSREQAREWLTREIPAWDIDGLKAAAATAWRQKLGRITIDGASAEDTTRLYTALFHSFIQPRDRTGDLPDFDKALPMWDDHYTLWDTWKTLFPLMAIVDPGMVRDNIQSFIARHRANGGPVSEGFIQGKEFRTGQGGNEVDNIIADAYAKRIPGVDWNAAYELLRFHAEKTRTPNYRERGWMGSDEKTEYSARIRSGSATLGYAYNDYNVAQVAKGLRQAKDFDRYLTRSQSWRNVWDDALTSDGFSGFVHGRAAQGQFSTVEATKGYNTDFYEGTCWEFSYDVPHDVSGLILKMGGVETFTRRLLHALKRGYIDFGNEPSFMTIWLFDQVKRPYLTSYWADQFRSKFKGLDLPGDDDSGAMSSLFLFLNAGLFPVAGQDVYYLHGARVPRFTFRQPNGKAFVIVGENAGPLNMYVQSATLNGRALTEPRIRHRDIVAGGTLRFVMGPRPSAWGTAGEFDAARAAEEIAPLANAR